MKPEIKTSGAGEPPERKPPGSEASPSVRWGVWVARRRWWVLSAWGVLMFAAALSYPHLISSLVASDYSVTGSDSQQVAQLIETDFTAAGAEQDVIVFNSDTLTITDAEGRPDPVPSAVGVAMTTSGRTILFSGTIVMISLFSLFVVNAPIFHGIAEGAVLVVACTLVTAWTMLPALMAALGDRVNRWALPKRYQPAELQDGGSEQHSGWARWARTVLAHPWLAIPAAALLLLFATPLFGIELGIDLGLAAVSDTPSGKAEIILTDSFTPGVLSPVQILASHEGNGALSAQDLATIATSSRRPCHRMSG